MGQTALADCLIVAGRAPDTIFAQLHVCADYPRLARASAALTVLEGAYEARRPLSEIPTEALFRELGRRGLPLPDDDGVTDQDRAAYAAGREAGACAPARRSGRAVRRVRPS